MSAVVDVNKVVKVVRVTPPKIERVTVADLQGVANADKVARILNAQTEALGEVFPKLPQEYTDFEFHMTAGKLYPLQHNYNTAVRAWLVNWAADSYSGATYQPYLLEVWPANYASVGVSGPVSDANTLVVLASGSSTGQATVRIAPRGV